MANYIYQTKTWETLRIPNSFLKIWGGNGDNDVLPQHSCSLQLLDSWHTSELLQCSKKVDTPQALQTTIHNGLAHTLLNGEILLRCRHVFR